MDSIKRVYAREILDSRGEPTLEVTVISEHGLQATAAVPAGASTGSHEALELRDNDPVRFRGKGVLKACQNVNGPINEALVGLDPTEQQKIDQRLIQLDGTPAKSRLGANAIVGVSLAAARLGAKVSDQPLYKYLRQRFNFSKKDWTMPTPLINVINGGRHADTNLDFQEFWIIPYSFPSFKEKVRAGSEVFHTLGQLLAENGLDMDVGAEGGYAPDVIKTEQVWQLLLEAVDKTNYQIGSEFFLGLDAGASTFYEKKSQRYLLDLEKESFSAAELMNYYEGWLKKYPILALEDPLAEDDWSAWAEFNQRLAGGQYAVPGQILIGDDLFSTTLTETMNCIQLAGEHQWRVVISHRSGETSDPFIADLAVAVGADFIKTGSMSRSERTAKYNRLMAIEDELLPS
ncbi:MAG: enolase [Candidatus Komeilibacteria bacterium]|nr:enolase [Candidatus Komeilibacteria bacterium]